MLLILIVILYNNNYTDISTKNSELVINKCKIFFKFKQKCVILLRNFKLRPLY